MSTDNSVTSVVKDIEQYEVAKKKAEEILKKDPLAVIPIDMYGTVETEDPFDIIEFFTPTIDDIEVVASKLIESIPIVGDVLGVVFQLFWQRATDEDKQKKKELEERLAEFKKEMIEIIDKKIEASEIEQWKRNCQSLVDGLASTLETLKDALERLRYQLVNGENVDPVSRESIRTKIDILRNDIKKVYIFTSDPKFVKSTIPHFLEAIFLYIFLIRSIDYFWYQWGIPEIEVVGRPATDKSKRLKSLREKLHEKIIDGLSIITENCQDADMLKNAHLILKNDLVLYPVPLIVGTPIKAKDQLKEKIHELDYSYVPEITIPEHSIPFIYRMDASCLRQDPKSQNISSMKRDFKYEPISGCHGQYLSGELLLKVNFPDSLKGKKVMIRLLSMHDSKYEGNINISFGKEIEQIPMIKEKISIFRKKDLFSRVVKKVSGMTYSKKFKINNSQNLSIHHNLRPVKRSDTTILDHLLGKVLFVEFVISP
ncbi:hypothetical protein DDB_G0277097 [Dictyostelium discoideum AX4]|uniref:Pesticidal crystal protein domain-containing protein n=1 Tax=Dictyostelium discoideum TaxID=44689 RepID=Q550I1_DICDI|nr:hypothetical protein DDB_G0277097 [Dictyostelium discoideum AX4]EAL69050.1 hypothetical protein DDB_G0277097 [Dictyostelium discoideum AX4]|eukprot:XP_642951.1 hypothetical protein DDB_G0277097 [Dictyostelium discoideum AX4]